MAHNAPSADPTPKATATVNSVNRGRASKCHVGAIRYHAIIASMTPSATMRSIRPVPSGASEMSSRGKYTLLIRCVLPVRLAAAAAIALAKNVHGINAANANNA
jgi:hypothetical protein